MTMSQNHTNWGPVLAPPHWLLSPEEAPWLSDHQPLGIQPPQACGEGSVGLTATVHPSAPPRMPPTYLAPPKVGLLHNWWRGWGSPRPLEEQSLPGRSVQNRAFIMAGSERAGPSQRDLLLKCRGPLAGGKGHCPEIKFRTQGRVSAVRSVVCLPGGSARECGVAGVVSSVTRMIKEGNRNPSGAVGSASRGSWDPALAQEAVGWREFTVRSLSVICVVWLGLQPVSPPGASSLQKEVGSDPGSASAHPGRPAGERRHLPSFWFPEDLSDLKIWLETHFRSSPWPNYRQHSYIPSSLVLERERKHCLSLADCKFFGLAFFQISWGQWLWYFSR